MKPDHTELLKQLLALPPEARAALAGSLIDSLDQELDEDVEAAWELEVARRLRELDEGEVAAIPWSEARRQIAAS
jgi:putative addiction module component (TIGR02574 family)